MKFVLDESLINEMLIALGELPFVRVAPLVERVHNEALVFHDANAPAEDTEVIDVEFKEVQPPAAQG